MPDIIFKTPQGQQVTINVKVGTSLLQAAQDNNIDLEGACGGSLACSTCHVIIDPDWFNILPEPREDEQDMLDLAFDPKPTSRLGCQIIVTQDLNGLTLIVPDQNRNLISHGH